MKRRVMGFVMLAVRRFGVGCCAAVMTAAAWAGAAHAVEQSFDCIADPSQTLKIGSPVSGILKEVLVGRGDHVKEGEIVATIDSEVEAATVELNRARAASQAEIQIQTARLENSRKALARAAELFKRKVATAARIEELSSEVKVIEGQLAQANLTQNLAQLELERSQKALDQRTIRSPIAGVVTQRLLSRGEFVFQEASIINLARVDPLFVEAFVPVVHHDSIRTGDTAQVRLSFNNGQEYPARVVVVDNVFDAASGTFGVRLELPNPGNLLPAGQRCKVRFALSAPVQPAKGD